MEKVDLDHSQEDENLEATKYHQLCLVGRHPLVNRETDRLECHCELSLEEVSGVSECVGGVAPSTPSRSQPFW